MRRGTPDAAVAAAIQLIASKVADQHGIPTAELYRSRQIHRVSRARQIAMWVAYHAVVPDRAAIGRHFNKTVSTTRYSIQMIEEHLAGNPTLADIAFSYYAHDVLTATASCPLNPRDAVNFSVADATNVRSLESHSTALGAS